MELERARKRGDHSAETEAAMRHLVGVLIHEPSVRARELAMEGRGDEFATALEAVFGIRPAEATQQDDAATA